MTHLEAYCTLKRKKRSESLFESLTPPIRNTNVLRYCSGFPCVGPDQIRVSSNRKLEQLRNRKKELRRNRMLRRNHSCRG
ncbi:hypothetical protein GCM10023156_17910 [Novipirellula rosea]|uniref:Uncharacterized protein n=1 Tax=Novipirellula rosea TaxID=1031540 RepID=A0ABP8MLK2_9BACT